MGFKMGAKICLQDMPIGRIDYGGESQRGWARTDISATGCAWLLFEDVTSLQNLYIPEIRRLDIALDTFGGEVTHDIVCAAHEAGRFISGGKPPSMTQITSSDPMAGKTCYVGKREQSDKFARCYEKGKEIAARQGGQNSSERAQNISDHYRCELELKAVNTVIPWSAISNRDEHFSGAYPFFADLLPGLAGTKCIRNPQKDIQADLAIQLENARKQFGPTLYTALKAYHGDMTAVWDKVVGNHHSQALLEAGVMLVDHE